MADSEGRSIIHRKARVGRQDFDARAMSPSKALRLSLAKTAETLLDLPLCVSTVEQTVLTIGAIPEQLGQDGLLILLDGGQGRRGAVKLDTQFIAALVEVQIVGQVRPGEAPERNYTRTDAAMAAPFLEHVLQGFDQQMSEHCAEHRAFEFRFGDRIEEARVLEIALEGGMFDCFTVRVELANAAKTGVITFLLPQPPAYPKEANRTQAGAEEAQHSLAQNALEATATLDAVLARIDMPLKRICALKAGMVLTLPAESLVETHLYAPGRHLVAEVRLGQLNGHRAVRLVSDMPSAETEAVPSAPSAAQNPDGAQHMPAAEILPAMPDLESAGTPPEPAASAVTIEGVAKAAEAEPAPQAAEG